MGEPLGPQANMSNNPQGEESCQYPKRNIPLIYTNLVQFEVCGRKQHIAQAVKIRDNPEVYRSSSTCAAELTPSDTLYLAQVLEMWAHMSKMHRYLFLEMVVVESSIARISKIRDCDHIADARAILRLDENYVDLSDKELDKKISFFKDQTDEYVRHLLTSSVKYQGYLLPFKPMYLTLDKYSSGSAFLIFCGIVMGVMCWMLWKIVYSMTIFLQHR